MAQIAVKEISSKSTWEKFMRSRKEGNFLQSFNWGQFHKNLGKHIHRIGFFESGELAGVMLCVVEKAKRATYLTTPGGPLINWQDREQVNLFKQTIENIAKQEGCSFVRVRPQILETTDNRQLFAKLGFKDAPMHLHAELTRELDLNKSEEELLSGMRKTTRYEIKQAIRLGIKIATSQNPKDMRDFYKLQRETAIRQKFVEFDEKFLTEQFAVFAADNQAVLYTAYLDRMKLTQAFIIFYGLEADYHYGASTLDGRKYPGAYLIQWQAIKEAKKRGLKRYNLWGVAPEGDVNHRFWGVSVFKRGFGGKDIAYLHAQDLIINPLAYKLNQVVELTRKKLRRL